MDDEEGSQRGLKSYREGTADEDDEWRQGGVGRDSTGHFKQDMPDDEVSEGILDLTGQFSTELRLVNGVPDMMLHTFTV